jgi:hypothetical protein
MRIMNSNQGPGGDPLQRLLREWALDTPLPPRFQEGVWRRIENAQASAPRATAWGPLRLWIERVLPRPAFAVGYLSLLLALGLGAGSFAAQTTANRLNLQLSARYAQSVDPFRMGRTTP